MVIPFLLESSEEYDLDLKWEEEDVDEENAWYGSDDAFSTKGLSQFDGGKTRGRLVNDDISKNGPIVTSSIRSLPLSIPVGSFLLSPPLSPLPSSPLVTRHLSRATRDSKGPKGMLDSHSAVSCSIRALNDPTGPSFSSNTVSFPLSRSSLFEKKSSNPPPPLSKASPPLSLSNSSHSFASASPRAHAKVEPTEDRAAMIEANAIPLLSSLPFVVTVCSRPSLPTLKEPILSLPKQPIPNPSPSVPDPTRRRVSLRRVRRCSS